MDQKRFSTLVEGLYDAALDPTGWARLIPTMAEAFETESCSIQTRDGRDGFSELLGASDNFDQKLLIDYGSYYHKKDLWVSRYPTTAQGSPILGSEYISDSELLNSEFYADLCRPCGLFHLVCSIIPVESEMLGVLGLYRAHGAKPFDATDKQALSLLLPHLTRAIQVRSRLGGLDAERRLGFAALESLSVGVMLVGGAGRLLFANAIAETLFRAGRGLVVRHGILRADDADKDQALRQAIDQAILVACGHLGAAGGMIVVPSPDSRPLTLMISPINLEALAVKPAQPVAMIFIGDPESQARPQQTLLAQLWGLTPAETRLTVALLDGERIETYADRIGISPQTARTQLKQIFSKSGCTRQSDLIREAFSNPVLRMRGPSVRTDVET